MIFKYLYYSTFPVMLCQGLLSVDREEKDRYNGRETQQRLLLAFGTGGRRSAPGRAGTRSKRYHDAAGHRAVAAEAGPGSEGSPTAVPGLLGGESPPPLAVSYAAEKPCVPTQLAALRG